MNKHDLSNIEFILTRTPEQLMKWWDTLSLDDQEYAVSIVNQYREELEAIAFYDNKDIDVSDAKNYLKKFQL